MKYFKIKTQLLQVHISFYKTNCYILFNVKLYKKGNFGLSFGKTFHPFFLCRVQTDSRFELHCSSDVVHIRTCSDSCAALMNLIQYIASYGDLHAANKAEVKPGAPQRKTTVQLASRLSERTPSAPCQPHEGHAYTSKAFTTGVRQKRNRIGSRKELPQIFFEIYSTA